MSLDTPKFTLGHGIFLALVCGVIIMGCVLPGNNAYQVPCNVTTMQRLPAIPPEENITISNTSSSTPSTHLISSTSYPDFDNATTEEGNSTTAFPEDATNSPGTSVGGDSVIETTTGIDISTESTREGEISRNRPSRRQLLMVRRGETREEKLKAKTSTSIGQQGVTTTTMSDPQLSSAVPIDAPGTNQSDDDMSSEATTSSSTLSSDSTSTLTWRSEVNDELWLWRKRRQAMKNPPKSASPSPFTTTSHQESTPSSVISSTSESWRQSSTPVMASKGKSVVENAVDEATKQSISPSKTTHTTSEVTGTTTKPTTSTDTKSGRTIEISASTPLLSTTTYPDVTSPEVIQTSTGFTKILPPTNHPLVDEEMTSTEMNELSSTTPSSVSMTSMKMTTRITTATTSSMGDDGNTSVPTGLSPATTTMTSVTTDSTVSSTSVSMMMMEDDKSVNSAATGQSLPSTMTTTPGTSVTTTVPLTSTEDDESTVSNASGQFSATTTTTLAATTATKMTTLPSKIPQTIMEDTSSFSSASTPRYPTTTIPTTTDPSTIIEDYSSLTSSTTEEPSATTTTVTTMATLNSLSSENTFETITVPWVTAYEDIDTVEYSLKHFVPNAFPFLNYM